MKPGRELDILVAARVFDVNEQSYLDMRLAELQRHALGHYHYSTDMSAAWTVFEKVIERYPYAVIQHLPAMKGVREKEEFEVYEEARAEFALGYGETAPLAICRAALGEFGAP